jgi:hypothetical protein
MKKSFAVALSFLFLLFTPLRALAIDYSDIWWNPSEPGWGVNIAQSDDFIFATFFVYGPNNMPTWYAGNLAKDGNGNYTGGLYSTTGTYLGTVPYNPGQFVATQVGVATFSPTAADTAVLTYNVGAVNVVKNIQRQTLTPIALGGSYSGGQQGAYSGSGCNLGDYTDHFDLQVEQPGDGSVTFSFTYFGNLTCTIAGTLQQNGQLYSIPNASYACSDGVNTSATITELKATSLGIEGRLAAPSVGGGCREDATFSGALWGG